MISCQLRAVWGCWRMGRPLGKPLEEQDHSSREKILCLKRKGLPRSRPWMTDSESGFTLGVSRSRLLIRFRRRGTGSTSIP